MLHLCNIDNKNNKQITATLPARRLQQQHLYCTTHTQTLHNHFVVLGCGSTWMQQYSEVAVLGCSRGTTKAKIHLQRKSQAAEKNSSDLFCQ